MNMSITRIILLFSIMTLSFSVAAVPPVFNARAGISSDNTGGDDEQIFHVGAQVLASYGLSRNRIVNLTGEFSLIDNQEFDERDGQELFLEAAYSYTPKAGYKQLTYTLAVRQEETFYDDDFFDSSTTQLLFTLGQYIDDQTKILGGLTYSDRSSTDDSSSTGIFINLDYIYNQGLVFYSTLNIVDEEIDIASDDSAGRPQARLDISGHHLPSEGSGSTGSSGATGSSNTLDQSDNTWLTLGASYALTAVDTLDFSANFRNYKLSNGVKIHGTLIALNFFHRF